LQQLAGRTVGCDDALTETIRKEGCFGPIGGEGNCGHGQCWSRARKIDAHAELKGALRSQRWGGRDNARSATDAPETVQIVELHVSP
jgi:hypothetical protein